MWAKHLMDYYKNVKKDVDIEVLPYNRSIYVHNGLNKFVRLYKGIMDYVALIRKTKKRIKQERFDVLHLCSSALLSLVRDYYVMRMARRNGVAGVLHFHCGRIPKIAEKGGWRWAVLKKAVENAKAVVVLDDESYNVLISHGFNKVYKVPNPLSDEMLQKIETMRTGIKRVPCRLVFVGHVIPSKGVFELVRACTEINNVELILVGRVEEAVKMELLSIASARKGEWMQLYGERGHDDVLSEMLSSDLFVFPSYTEGFPNVILEAMACGIPIIASEVGAIPEMLDNGKCGILIQPQDVMSVKNAVEALVNDEERKALLSKCSKERVVREYGISSVWMQLQTVWRNA